MILLATLACGLLSRVFAGRSFASLSRVHLRGETLLLVFLVLQTAVPALALQGTAARVAFWVWVATFPVVIAVAAANWRFPGMVLIASGLLMNLMVVLANGGMPVAASAVAAAHPGMLRAAIPVGDFVHVDPGAATRLVWLADVLPVPGPAALRSVVSSGDVLLFAGVFAATAVGQALASTPSRQ